MGFFDGDDGTWVDPSDYGEEHATFNRLREMMPRMTQDWIAQIGEMDNQLSGAYEAFAGTAMKSMGEFIKGAAADLANYKDNWAATEAKYNKNVRSMMEEGRYQADAGRAMQDQAQAADQAVAQMRRQAQSRGIDVGSDPGAMANELQAAMAKNAMVAQAGTNQYNQSEDRAIAMGRDAAQMGQAIKESGYDKYGTASEIGSMINTNALNTAQGRAGLLQSQLIPMGFEGDLAQAQAGIRSREYDERMASEQFKSATSGPSAFESLSGAAMGAFAGNMSGQAGTRAGNAIFSHDGGAIPEDMNTRANASPPTGPEYPAVLEQGEYVIPKEVVQQKGTEFFDRMVEKYAPQKGANQAIPTGGR